MQYTAVRKANTEYFLDTFSLDFKDNSQNSWAFVKSKGQDASGVAPLEDKDSFLQSEQFVSAFTCKNSNIPDM